MRNDYHIMNNHYGIINQYSILNECLQLISRSKIKTIDKLKIEATIIRVKKLLLNDVQRNEIQCGFCGEDVFEGLLYQMRRSCGGGCEEDVLANSIERIGRILTVLGGDPITGARSMP